MERIAETSIGPENSGAELLEWLVKRFTYADAARWTGFIRSGELRINGEPTQAGYLLREGDLVAFKPAGLTEPAFCPDYRVLFEDEDYAIIDKPAHLCCHPAGPFFKNSLWHLLKEAGYRDFHFASRLDRETSGVLALCKTKEAMRAWESARAAARIEKTYAVIVHGEFPPALEARGFLVPDEKSPIRKKRRFVPAAEWAEAEIPEGGERCSTAFRLLRSSKDLSLVQAVLGTGRTHQIRASLFSLGYPVLGDKLYGLDDEFFLRFGSGSLCDSDRERLRLGRQALHSMSLRFPSRSGSMLSFSSDLPPELSIL
jgi:RluA family pseudouridine synthase